jgi:pimeloyl-ACP methyl ester carboxylesterase
MMHPKNSYDVVFLHGWGSNKELMKKAFGREFGEYRHIYIDMPGFGKSSADIALSTDDYAHIVELFLHTIHSDKEVIIGHSFGGKVATLLSPKILVLLSSAGIIEPKSLSVKIKILIAKIFGAIGLGWLSKIFRSKDVESMSESMYSTFKNVVNEDFSQKFASYTKKSVIFWGKQDGATTLRSGEQIARLIKGSKFVALEGDHYFFLHHAKTIYKTIKELSWNK